jgi:hypothetical protein
MCGRCASLLPAEAIARIFGTVKPLPDLAPFWNVAQPDAGRGSCAPSPGHRRSPPRSAEVGFAAALGEGTDQRIATDQRALIGA